LLKIKIKIIIKLQKLLYIIHININYIKILKEIKIKEYKEKLLSQIKNNINIFNNNINKKNKKINN